MATILIPNGPNINLTEIATPLIEIQLSNTTPALQTLEWPYRGTHRHYKPQ